MYLCNAEREQTVGEVGRFLFYQYIYVIYLYNILVLFFKTPNVCYLKFSVI